MGKFSNYLNKGKPFKSESLWGMALEHEESKKKGKPKRKQKKKNPYYHGKYFDDPTDGYIYMYNKSNAKCGVEMCGWQTYDLHGNKGFLLNPWHRNTKTKSYNDYFRTEITRKILYDNIVLIIAGHVHTHPCNKTGYEGPSDEDMNIYRQFGGQIPIYVIGDNQISKLNPSKIKIKYKLVDNEYELYNPHAILPANGGNVYLDF
jgi:hypothetical protein